MTESKKPKKLKSLKKVNDKEEVQLNDFIIESQLIKYKDKITTEFKADKFGFISKDDSLKILEKYSSSKTNEIVEILSESDNESIIELKPKKNLKKNAIDFANNLFHYGNKNFSFIKTDDEIYFKGKDIAEFLEYNDTKQAIHKNISEDEKITLEKIIEENYSNFKGVCQTPLKGNEKNTIYITEAGLYELILSSKKEEAKAFKKFITKELLPYLRKTGTYNLNNTVNTDISFIKSFYDDNDISDFLDTNVVYLIAIGIYNGGILIKYGKSSRIYERDFYEHKRTFGEQIKMLAIIPTDNNDEVETIFKKTIRAKGLDVKLEFNGKDRDELFVTNNNFTMEKAMELMQIIAEKNPLKSIKEKDERIKELQFQQDNEKYVLVAKERTKQVEIREIEQTKQEGEKTKQMELELKKQEEIHKIEEEKTKQMELELKKQEEIHKTEEEKTKQLEIKLKLAEIQMQRDIKKNNDEKKQENTDLYLQFINECTEKCDTHIHACDLYEGFKIWFKNNNPNTKIPINKEFSTNIKKYLELKKHVRIDKKISPGFYNLKIKNEND
jgi:prophage antirepressor-like protein